MATTRGTGLAAVHGGPNLPKPVHMLHAALPSAVLLCTAASPCRYKGLLIGDPREGRRILLQRPGGEG